MRAGRTAIRAGLLAILVAISLFFLSWQGAAAATLTVTTEADENGTGAACSLREAIIALNTASDFGGCDGSSFGTNDRIEFNIPAGAMANPPVARIQPNPRLPNLLVPMTIDGYTQAGAQRNTVSATSSNGLNSVIRVEIDGSLQPNGPIFRVRGGSTTITGLAIFGGPSDGIHLQVAGNNVVVGNYIGTDATGNGGDDNDGDGVFVDGTDSGNRIGGTAAADRNLISGNERVGIRVKSDDTTIQGNLIGTNRSGRTALANERNGIAISAGAGTLVGGDSTSARNVVSGNDVDGILVSIERSLGCGCPEGTVEDTTIANNFVGVDVTGTTALGNGKNGIQVQFLASGTTIGPNNVISGNHEDGINLRFPGDDTEIIRNLIGVGADRSTPVGNQRNGINSIGTVDDDFDVTIGGAPADGNVIARNLHNGVLVSEILNCVCIPTVFNRIQGNAIFLNGRLGIDLGGEGVTPNDEDDPDDGANFRQNFPELATTIAPDGKTDVDGTLNSTPDTEFEIDLYVSASCDPSGFGEGQQFLRRLTVTTDGNGDATFSLDGLPPSNGLPFLTATATDPDGNTSEFSECAPFGSQGPDDEGSPNNDPNNDDKEDEEKDDEKKETEEQRQQRERTNRSNKSEYATEGNVLDVERTPDGKHLLVTIGLTKNERLVVQVTCIELKCPDIRVGDYLEADGYQNGVGDENTYFIAETVTIRRNGKKVT